MMEAIQKESGKYKITGFDRITTWVETEKRHIAVSKIAKKMEYFWNEYSEAKRWWYYIERIGID